MNKHSLVCLSLTVALVGVNAHPLLATSLPEPSPTSSEVMTIPMSSALVVTFPVGLQLDTSQVSNYPMVLPLASPILNSNGVVIAPAQTQINVSLVPVKGGVQILGKSLIINGQIIPIKAQSEVIPTEKVALNSDVEEAKNQGAFFGNLGRNLGGSIGNTELENANRGAMAEQAFGLLIGIFRKSKTVPVLNIPPETQYVLSLQREINFPSINAQEAN